MAPVFARSSPPLTDEDQDHIEMLWGQHQISLNYPVTRLSLREHIISPPSSSESSYAVVAFQRSPEHLEEQLERAISELTGPSSGMNTLQRLQQQIDAVDTLLVNYQRDLQACLFSTVAATHERAHRLERACRELSSRRAKLKQLQTRSWERNRRQEQLERQISQVEEMLGRLIANRRTLAREAMRDAEIFR
ncbi:hypothetical protein ACTWM0_25525 [Pseudomonas machongensis]